MAILINDTTPRSQYTATSGQTVFTVPFEFFENSDLKVYKNSTLLTLTTNYTVTGAGVTNGGSITLVSGATAGDILTIVRDVPVKRVTDFPTSGPFNVDALNSDLDRLTAMVQQQEALDGRSLRLDQFDTPNTLNTLPAKADRVGRVLQFNSSTGQPEAGPTTSEIANAQTYASNASTSATAAASSASSASTSASNASTSATNAASSASSASTSASNASSSASAASTSASNASTSASNASTSATAAAGSASTASTQASNASSSASAAASSASAAATSASNAATSETNASSSASAASASQIAAAASAAAAAASYDSFDDRYLGVKASDPTVDNDGNALVSGALYYNSTTATMKVYDGANWIAATSAGNTSLLNYRYVATAGQTTFSGADANSATLSYAPNNIIVSRNGVVFDPTDYTATSGTSVVLVNAATVGDNINIVAFKSFTTADMVPASTGGTFNGGVNVTGNLGIGTTTPAASVSITKQTTALSGTGNAYGLYAYPTSSGLAYIDAVTSGSGNTSLGFRTYNNGTYNDAVRIDSSGNLLVGTTSFPTGGGGGAGIASAGYIATSRTTTATAAQMQFFNPNGQVGKIETSGSSTTYATSSDYRLKNSVAPMTSGLATVSALKPVTYKWNVDDSDGEGFIAHELQSVIPHAVTGEKDAVDEDGSIKPQGVDYSKIVVYLVSAIQELSAKNDALEARLAILEGATQ
jgi:plastocyanin